LRGLERAATFGRPMRTLDTIDSGLLLAAALRRAAEKRGGPVPSIDVADARLDERREWAEWAILGADFSD
jgi:hypothetical protein